MSVRAIHGEIVPDDPCLPEPESVGGGEGPYIIPIVDDVYGGVIAWANSKDQAERIVAALNRFAMNETQREAVAALVAYSYASEERDAVEMGQEGDPRHIFTSIQTLQEWLEGNTTTEAAVTS